MEHHNTHCLSLSTISSHSYQFDSEGRIWQNSIVKDSKQILINKNYRIERNKNRFQLTVIEEEINIQIIKGNYYLIEKDVIKLKTDLDNKVTLKKIEVNNVNEFEYITNKQEQIINKKVDILIEKNAEFSLEANSKEKSSLLNNKEKEEATNNMERLSNISKINDNEKNNNNTDQIYSQSLTDLKEIMNSDNYVNTNKQESKGNCEEKNTSNKKNKVELSIKIDKFNLHDRQNHNNLELNTQKLPSINNSNSNLLEQICNSVTNLKTIKNHSLIKGITSLKRPMSSIEHNSLHEDKLERTIKKSNSLVEIVERDKKRILPSLHKFKIKNKAKSLDKEESKKEEENKEKHNSEENIKKQDIKTNNMPINLQAWKRKEPTKNKSIDCDNTKEKEVVITQSRNIKDIQQQVKDNNNLSNLNDISQKTTKPKSISNSVYGTSVHNQNFKTNMKLSPISKHKKPINIKIPYTAKPITTPVNLSRATPNLTQSKSCLNMMRKPVYPSNYEYHHPIKNHKYDKHKGDIDNCPLCNKRKRNREDILRISKSNPQKEQSLLNEINKDIVKKDNKESESTMIKIKKKPLTQMKKSPSASELMTTGITKEAYEKRRMKVNEMLNDIKNPYSKVNTQKFFGRMKSGCHIRKRENMSALRKEVESINVNLYL